MMIEERTIASRLPRARIWTAMTDLDRIGLWSGFARCISTGRGVLEGGRTYVCRLEVAGDVVDASLCVTALERPSLLGLRTESSMAVVDERIRLEPTAEGTDVHYAISATSSMFGPAVKMWLARHVSVVHGGLAAFVGDEGAIDTRPSLQSVDTDATARDLRR